MKLLGNVIKTEYKIQAPGGRWSETETQADLSLAVFPPVPPQS